MEQSIKDFPPVKRYLDEQKMLADADSVAERAHFGQVRKDGQPYITHPRAVANIVTTEFFSLMPQNALARANWSAVRNHVIAAAYLHDTIEDTYVTSDYLRNYGFSEMTIEIVQLCTKRPGENYFDFIMRLQESGHVGAKIVKLADLQHNMSDLKEGAMKDKYRFAQYILSYFND